MSDDSEGRELLRRRRRERAETTSYTVGYAKPDRQHSFKPGNTMGSRPRKQKAAESHDEMVNRIANQKVTLLDGGRKVWKTKHEVALERLANDAARGDPKARKLWLDEYAKARHTRPRDDLYYEKQHDDAAEVRRRIEEMSARFHAAEALPSPDRGTDDNVEPPGHPFKKTDGGV